MDFVVSSAVPFPTLLVHLSLAQGGLCHRVSKSRQVFEAPKFPALSSLQGAEESTMPTSSQNAPWWECLSGCTGEGVEDLLGYEVIVTVNSLLPCMDKPSGDVTSAVAVATARFPSLSDFQPPSTWPERQLLKHQNREERKPISAQINVSLISQGL